MSSASERTSAKSLLSTMPSRTPTAWCESRQINCYSPEAPGVPDGYATVGMAGQSPPNAAVEQGTSPMTALTLPRTLIDPGTGVATAVQERRILWPLLALMAATSFAGAAFALRWDPAPEILQKLEMSGQLKGMPEAELLEQITTAGRLKLVTAIASGVFVTPLVVLGIAVVLAIVAWLLGRKAPFPALFSASAVGMLPIADALNSAGNGAFLP